MFVYVDDDGRILATNSNDMSGNSGWVDVDGEVIEPITNEYGIPIYKFEDGAVVSRTEEEIAGDASEMEPPAPSEIDELRQQLAEQQTILEEQADALIELAELIGGD